MRFVRPASSAVLLTLTLVLSSAPPVHAKVAVAPPGNSAVDQYRESAPPAAPGSRPLSAAQRRRLAAQGADGAALAEVLDRNGGVARGAAPGTGATTGKAGNRRSPRSGSAADTPDDDADRGGTTLPGAAAAATVGPVPIWVMLVVAGLLVAASALRRRFTS